MRPLATEFHLANFWALFTAPAKNRAFRFLAGLTLAPLALALLAAPAMAGEKDDIEALVRASKARAAIVKQASRAVVHISVTKNVQGGPVNDPFNDEFFRRFFGPRMPMPQRNQKQQAMGSGVILDEQGTILTNNHVAGDADEIKVKLSDGREFKAKLLGADPATDVAVIRIQGKNLPTAKLGNSDELEVGESVIAIGNPFGLEQTITAGIVSAKGRSGMGVTDYEDFIQTDASINPGNSGGPLVNLRGEVVGINTAIFSRSGGSMGIGFAIPIKMAHSVMESLMKEGHVERGFLGVAIQEITQDLGDALGLPSSQGVLLTQVGPKSPAEKGGLKDGDVVVAVNGRSMHDANQFRNLIAATRPNTEIELAIVRDKKPMSLKLKLGQQPKDMAASLNPEEAGGAAPNGWLLGMRLEPLAPQQAKRLGYDNIQGLLVTELEPGGLMAQMGLQPGAVILDLNRQPVSKVAAFKKLLGKIPSGSKLLIRARMGAMIRFIAVSKP